MLLQLQLLQPLLWSLILYNNGDGMERGTARWVGERDGKKETWHHLTCRSSPKEQENGPYTTSEHWREKQVTNELILKS